MKKLLMHLCTQYHTLQNIQRDIESEKNEDKRIWLIEQHTLINDEFEMDIARIERMVGAEDIIGFVKASINKDYNFEKEYWDSGNFDDAHQIGIETGEQYAYLDVMDFINKRTREN